MRSNEIYILSTRPLEKSLYERTAKTNICIDSLSFIRAEPIKDDYLKDTILNLSKKSSTIIFTSQNAAEAVAAYLNGYLPDWKIYSIGNATREAINRHFKKNSIQGTAINAFSLAEIILNNHVRNAVFFCGDQRREELPEILNKHLIFLKEIVVYKTILTPKKINKNYHGILFFSPSAVKSFFCVNIAPVDCVLFAIGDTTAECLRLNTTNKIIVSSVSRMKTLIEEVLFYFESNK